jgi:hypothetical protein
MSKEIIIVDKPMQSEDTLNKQCINGTYPNWCVRTEGAKVGETFLEWWKRKQDEVGHKMLGIYLYDIQPIGGIIGRPRESALYIRYDYIMIKEELDPIMDEFDKTLKMLHESTHDVKIRESILLAQRYKTEYLDNKKQR